ncbi:MAG: sigma-70 family RNA polymerase sigma factor [Oscillospiraceae bacterium]|nr:sigma-70 family RNA polymerase sigma factor [Oscillospiraceae bacterium]
MEKQKADRIITEFLPKIYGFAVKKSFSPQETDELCSDILLEVYRTLLRSEEVYNVEGYIWRISERTYSKYVAEKKRRDGISLDFVSLEAVLSYEDEALPEEADEELRLLRREVAFLTEKRREVVFRFYYEGKSISQIASELGIPSGTVKWHLNKAKKELKEGFTMERNIGKLGLSPLEKVNIGHSGNIYGNGDPEQFLGDKLNLNIVYSVYHTPRTLEGIAEELGVTPVYLKDRVDMLEANGFLVQTAGKKYTTYVLFGPTSYSLEEAENCRKLQLQVAEELVETYVPLVRKAVEDVREVYLPDGNRELLEATAIFYCVAEKCCIRSNIDQSKYQIHPLVGGEYVAMVWPESTCEDPDYVPTLKLPTYWACGSMYRTSCKYPVSSFSMDTRYDNREGTWKNNCLSDYEWLYEQITGQLSDNAANAEKYARLRERKFLTEDGRVNIPIVKGTMTEFFEKLPSLHEEMERKFARTALDFATQTAKRYPPQMQDLVISRNIQNFIGSAVALMVLDILYGNGTFRPLTENERVSANLLMFSDVLPGETK